MRISELHGQKIAIWGFGREGQATCKIIQEHAPQAQLTILNDTPLPPESLETLQGIPVITGHAVADALRQAQVVIKSPGISPYIDAVKDAKHAGTLFTSATNLWFAEHPQQKTVCVTGTKGKSTTSTLIATLLKAAGLSVEFAGNIGIPLLERFHLEPAPDVFVIELSSYQTCEFTGSPDIAVLLNLYPEHLNWHGSKENYFHDKTQIFQHMKPEGISIFNPTDPETASRYASWHNPRPYLSPSSFHIDEDIIYDQNQKIVALDQLQLQGSHNLNNICAALTVLKEFNISPEKIIGALTRFRGLPHRMMSLGHRAGILYIDDSISTTPQSAIAALKTYRQHPTTLLVGGYDRGLDWSELVDHLIQFPIHCVITMPDTGPSIANQLKERGANASLLFAAKDLQEAVNIAQKNTPVSGVILLSPAAPSYHQFKNFEDRGAQFANFSGF